MQPHIKEYWKIPPKEDAAFVAAMEDVLEVYGRPVEPSVPVVCMDESSKQLVGEVSEPLPAVPGSPAKQDSEYVRNGVASIFMFTAPHIGWSRATVTERRTCEDWAVQIRTLVDVDFPDAEKIVLVLDNLNTHFPASLYKAFPPAEARRILERLELHYTPKHGSWLNIAEIELSVLSSQCLDRRIPDIETLSGEVEKWCEDRNSRPRKIDWQFRNKDARIKLKSLYPKVEVEGS